jgi:hypothetical protein
MAAMRTPQEVIVAVAERSGGEDTRVAPEWEEKKIPATLRTSGRRTLAVFLGCTELLIYNQLLTWFVNKQFSSFESLLHNSDTL